MRLPNVRGWFARKPDVQNQYIKTGWPIDISAAGIDSIQRSLIGNSAYARYARWQVFQNATLNRCVMLVAGTITQAIMNGDIYIVNADNRRVTGGRVRGILRLLMDDPRSDMKAIDFVSAISNDYAATGNFIIAVDRNVNGVPGKLTRYDPDWVNQVRSETGTFMYHIAGIDNMIAKSPRNVLHGKWPAPCDDSSSYLKRGFTPTPVFMLSRAIINQMLVQKETRHWLEETLGDSIGNLFTLTEKGVAPEYGEQIRQNIFKQYANKKPYVVLGEGAKREPLLNYDYIKETESVLSEADRQITSLYGIPPIFLSKETSTWGSGIEVLAKALNRFSLSHHMVQVLGGLQPLLMPGQRFMFDSTSFARGDMADVGAFLGIAGGDSQRQSILSQEEARRLAGLPVDMQGEPLQGYNPAVAREMTEQ